MAEARRVAEQVLGLMPPPDAAALEQALALLAADVHYTGPDLDVRGREAVRAVWESYFTAFPDLSHETLDRVESADAVALELRWTGTHTGALATADAVLAATGRRVVFDALDLVRVADGRIVSWHGYFDQIGFNRQLGVESPAAG